MAHALDARSTTLSDAPPQVRRIGVADLRAALHAGYDDFLDDPDPAGVPVPAVSGDRLRRRPHGDRRPAPAAVPADRRLVADGTGDGGRLIRAQPPARGRAAGVVAPRLRRAAVAGDRRHRRARARAAGAVRPLDRRGTDDLPRDDRPGGAGRPRRACRHGDAFRGRNEAAAARQLRRAAVCDRRLGDLGWCRSR